MKGYYKQKQPYQPVEETTLVGCLRCRKFWREKKWHYTQARTDTPDYIYDFCDCCKGKFDVTQEEVDELLSKNETPEFNPDFPIDKREITEPPAEVLKERDRLQRQIKLNRCQHSQDPDMPSRCLYCGALLP